MNLKHLDLDRVFASGFSWGADFSHSLACCQGNNVRAIAPLSGSDVFANSMNACEAHEPAVLMQYGLDDQAYSQESYKQSIGFYLKRNSCGSSSQALPGNPNCLVGDGCKSPLIVCAIPGQNHEVKTDEIFRAVKFLRVY